MPQKDNNQNAEISTDNSVKDPKKQGKTCKWCGTKSCEGLFCSNCKGPLTPKSSVLFISKLALIPLSIIIVGYVIQWLQKTHELNLQRERALCESYVLLTKAYSDYREADVKLFRALSIKDTTEKREAIERNIYKLDRAFNDFGHMLMPFDIEERRHFASDSQFIKDVWHNCFIFNYFGNEHYGIPDSTAYWNRLVSILIDWEKNGYNPSYIEQIDQLRASIYCGECVKRTWDRDTVYMADFFDLVKRIITTESDNPYICRRPKPDISNLPSNEHK